MKWGVPSEPAWTYLRSRHPDLANKGEQAFRIAAAYDAGRDSVIDALAAGRTTGIEEVRRMMDETAYRLRGPVQLLSSEYDEATHRITFTWERR